MYFPDIDSMPKSTYTIQTGGIFGDIVKGIIEAPKNIIQGVIGIGKDIISGNVTLPSGETLKDVIKEKQQPKTHVIKAPEPQPAPKPAPIRTQEEEKMPSWIWIVAIGGVLLVVLLAR